MTVTRTTRLGLVLWSTDEDALSTFREDLVESFQALETRAALAADLTAETNARVTAVANEAGTRAAADTALTTALASKVDKTAQAATTDLKAVLVAAGLLTAGGATPLALGGAALSGVTTLTTSGNATVGGTLTVTSATATLNGVQIATTADITAGTGSSGKTNQANTWSQTQTFGNATKPLDATAGPSALAAASFSGLITANGGLSLAAGQDVTIAATTGSRIGQSGSRIGFYGATPVLRPGTYSVDSSTATDRTLAAYTAAARGTAYTATPAALTDGATLADLNNLRTAYETLRAYVEDLGGLTAANTRDLITVGIFG